ncbi:MAG: hypothetical protein NC548_64740 [Lachnospiraceae bacterium]|nr:hypothetical protein [Lachnospiraceae bacterium]
MKGAGIASEILSSLSGRKHLIRGNHDKFVDSPEFESSLFVDVQDYMEVTCLNTRFVLFHYPIVKWNGFYKGTIALHGHQHNHNDYNIENPWRNG